MSANLIYITPTAEKSVPASPSFRDAIAERGNLDYSDLEYLRGWGDAGEEGAQILIDAIEKYGEITVAKR